MEDQPNGDLRPELPQTPFAPPPSDQPARGDGNADGNADGNGGDGNADGNGAGSRGPWRDFDPPAPGDDVLERHGALVLDPRTAVRAPGQPLPRPTTYLAASLIVPFSMLRNDGLKYLTDALKTEEMSIDLVVLREQAALFDGVPAAGVAVVLQPSGDHLAEPPDAWVVLQRARANASRDHHPERLAGLGLNHLLFAGSHVDGHPVEGMSHVDGHPVYDSYGLAEYVMAGSGGRAPVSWVGRAPDRRAEVPERRSVVAVLDTGCGQHDWLQDGVVRKAAFKSVPAQVDAIPDPEASGDVIGPMDGALDSHAGHGTFIAGLIRQISPDTDILALRIMASDGIVQEGDLLQAMSVLHALTARGKTDDNTPFNLDLVSLSLGYYHESPGDEDLDPLLSQQVEALSALGVCVVACAGNDATRRKMYPAAFAPRRLDQDTLQTSDQQLPLLSVGALNPDGSTALFSNGGRWVLTWEVGAAVVSTFPTTFNGGAQPSVRVHTNTGRPRSTIDPDSFAGGFGTWSGTSFSTPILAARMADRIQRLLDNADATPPIQRMWETITAVTGLHSQ